MKAKRIAMGFACAAVGVLAATPGASAKPGYGVIPASFFLSANLPKSNGYSIHLGSVNHRWVEMFVHRRGEIAIYLTRGGEFPGNVPASHWRAGDQHFDQGEDRQGHRGQAHHHR
jgi:hypothetical protein